MAGVEGVDLEERLDRVFHWYRGMVSSQTGRLVYAYDPRQDLALLDGSAIRRIASVWDLARLGRHLGRADLRPVVERSIGDYTDLLVGVPGGVALDADRLGEPSGIAHSAFLVLALLDAGLPGQEDRVATLAEGLLHQQRADGTFRVHFGPEPDLGFAFYPGEAMLALMRAADVVGGDRCFASVARGFAACARRLPPDEVEPELLVFYANWQSRYAVLLHERASGRLRDQIRDHVFALHDLVVRSGFYAAVEHRPWRQATVEVACALEGLTAAYALAVRVGDGARVRRYRRCARVALDWLVRAQRLEGTPRERGGFGHSWSDRTQRIDVTGHVVSGWLESLATGIASDQQQEPDVGAAEDAA